MVKFHKKISKIPNLQQNRCDAHMMCCLKSVSQGNQMRFSLNSGSISRRNFLQFKRFLERLVDQFDVSETGTHVALVEYSTDASVQLRFNDFSGAELNAVNVKRKISSLPHTRGFTYIDKALGLADRELFSAKGGMRPNVTKVIFLNFLLLFLVYSHNNYDVSDLIIQIFIWRAIGLNRSHDAAKIKDYPNRTKQKLEQRLDWPLHWYSKLLCELQQREIAYQRKYKSLYGNVTIVHNFARYEEKNE